MKKLPFFFAITLFSLSLFSKTKIDYLPDIDTGSITGKIIEQASKEPLDLVNIVVKNNTDDVITGGVSVSYGSFNIKQIPFGIYTIETQFIGYKTFKKAIELTESNPHIDLGTIQLEENTTVLDDVNVKAKTTTITRTVDKTIINVGEDLTTSGANGYDMLQSVPFVVVDPQNESISLRGSNNVRVFIDGKPSNLSSAQALKQIPSNTIKQIELITNPSAKYTAEGTGGIINFILKKNKQYGFNGSVTAGVEHAENTRPEFSTNMNYRTGKVNFFANYGYDFGKLATYSGLYRTDKDQDQDIDFIFDDIYQTLKVGADIYINDKNTLSFYTSQLFDDADYLINTRVKNNGVLSIHQDLDSKIKSQEQTYNVDYKLNIDDKGHSIEFDASYIKTENPENNIYSDAISPTNKEYNFFNTISNDTDTWLLHIDYVNPLSDTSKLEAGFDIRLFSTFNQILSDQAFSNAPVGDNNLSYDRNIYASYLTYKTKFGKFSVKGGLRFELFEVDGIFNNIISETKTSLPYTDEVFNVYPSAFITYNATENDEWFASYSRRVDRPGISQITPIPDFSTPLTISTGNQDLQPQYTNTVELNYTRSYKKGYTSLGSIYKATNDKIDRAIQTNTTSNPDLQILSYVNNEDGIKQFGFEFYTELKVTKWLKTNLSANYYRQDRTGLVGTENITIKNNRFYTRLNNRFNISKTFSLQLNGFYSAKSRTPIFIIKPYGYVNFASRLRVLDGNGSINFKVNDIFKTLNIRFKSTRPFAQTGFIHREFRPIYLGFTYNFGSGKNKARKRKYRRKNETRGSGTFL